MIKNLTIKALQKAINRALSLDETRLPKLQALEGKAIEVIITPLNVNFFIYFSQGELQLLSDYNGHIDTIIHSSPLGLIRLSVLPASKVRSLFNDQIKVSGDVELGQEVKKLFDELDIDWEGHLAQFTGDVVAYQVGSFFRRGLTFKRRTVESLQQNITEYLQEELRMVPPREEMNDFFKEVDDLSLRVERLAAHVNQLRARYEAD
ncbi:ubiquinone biosynthesis accessory factor UbiJ [Legionella oakridgensis]|uniref:Ubiquinone biosynthesis accessory factor UbiJ n=2 Tax=Legionella oakridgensis TaxID=29423 RepID=W0BI49_9GAMM|nr:SCP2 sterol-binding domain-containing protein [Legionella oakridgensis]AHE68366.1 hypothetical protein Loa_02837 [Legionella oakridgensis ATCC 33761 = DSM 21215]ETO92174.1 hypothetical protein LOR_38c04350 [Legionella oakridgensis RV-2-2007]KTD38965.1 SCP-2 sterol transfer family protein [Legionella oakridgensis]STY21307.1 Protein YigP [Legionella longbeachae]